MKVFVMTDLEGASGVAGYWSDIDFGGKDYETARRLLTGDVNAAIEGAFEAGADEVVVLDGHGAALTILIEELDPRTQLIRGRRVLELEGLDESFNLMFAIGAHSMAGTSDGLLTHTLSPDIDNVWLNDVPVGEVGLWAALAGDYNVPLVLVAGDFAAVREAESLLKNVCTVAVKKATSRFAAKCLHPKVSQKLIREAAATAVRRAGEFTPFKPEKPIELRVEFHDSERAERFSHRRGVVRVSGRTVSAKGTTMLEVYSLLLG
ncbi:M55 family metallopeptidase [Candidatus Bathyarchaeota archaeon]|nr:M55 family metallopeptidase [Candidatus Bathyarchaeota archaeon]MBS7613313.1 M55 family metallopeptidase [Candidatus Bathyarchaeota archaeon]MBS7618360.1 M55 family metallopeptidase [Candidatus Bathyarchaeota archaeon]